jgi:branched-chain amino acid transport system permease protein
MQRYLADFGAWYLILLGTLGILIMLFAPRGLWGLILNWRDVTIFPIRRRLAIRAVDEKRA